MAVDADGFRSRTRSFQRARERVRFNEQGRIGVGPMCKMASANLRIANRVRCVAVRVLGHDEGD